MLKANWLKSKTLAITWFMIINILFFLPGSSFPKGDWMVDIQLDKLVHAGFFAVLVFLWASAFELGLPKNSWLLLTFIAIYGLTVEIIQKFWIPNRSFDLYDVVLDLAGSVIGLFVWLRVYKKNKPL